MTLRQWFNCGGSSPAYLYPDDGSSHHYIPKHEYSKLMDCGVDLIQDNDYDEDGNNYGVLWGFVTLPSNMRCCPETGLLLG